MFPFFKRRSDKGRKSVSLGPGELSRISRGKDQVIKVLDGRLWITEAHVPTDSFVSAGESYRIRTNGLAILENDSDEGTVFELLP